MTRHTVRPNQALTGGAALGLACSLPLPGGLLWQPGWAAAVAVVLLGVILWFGVQASAAETAATTKDHAQLARTAGELGLRTPEGSFFPLARTARSSAVLLLFVQAAHSPSMHVMAAAQAWRDTDPRARTIKFVVNESELARNIPPTLAETDVLLDSGRTNTRLAGIESYPAAILIGHDTRFAVDPVHGAENIEVLVADLEQVWPRSTSK